MTPSLYWVVGVNNKTHARWVGRSAAPQFSPLIDDETLRAVAAKPPSRLPAFRYAAPRVADARRGVALLGDAIHTVKPYFGLGANSALEDVTALAAALDGAALDGAAAEVMDIDFAPRDPSDTRAHAAALGAAGLSPAALDEVRSVGEDRSGRRESRARGRLCPRSLRGAAVRG